MPLSRRYYDPFIEQPTTPPTGTFTTRGLFIEKPGLYLHVSEVVDVLNQMAETVEGEAAEALLAAAASFEKAQPG